MVHNPKMRIWHKSEDDFCCLGPLTIRGNILPLCIFSSILLPFSGEWLEQGVTPHVMSLFASHEQP